MYFLILANVSFIFVSEVLTNLVNSALITIIMEVVINFKMIGRLLLLVSNVSAQPNIF